MAVDLLSDTSSSRGISPRISFSHDLKNCEIVPIEQNSPLKTSLLDYDFDFCVSKRSSDQNSSLADELFENGVILPIQIKRKDIKFMSKNKSSSSSFLLPPLSPHSSNNNTIINNNDSITKDNEDINSSNNNINDNNSKLFWKFKRSKSLNCGRIYRRGLCSLPILSRSKSTGSTSAKKSLISKEDSLNNNNNNNNNNSSTNINNNIINNGKMGTLKNNNSSNNSNSQKPPLKKNYGGTSYNHGVSPIINVVPSGSLFGFGSLFSNGKDKSKKK